MKFEPHDISRASPSDSWFPGFSNKKLPHAEGAVDAEAWLISRFPRKVLPRWSDLSQAASESAPQITVALAAFLPTIFLDWRAMTLRRSA
jgi:hypothetical protein